MEGNTQDVLKQQEEYTVKSVYPHTYEERPFLAFAGETPEEHKKTSNETVDDQIEEHSSGTGLVRERVDYLSDANPTMK